MKTEVELLKEEVVTLKKQLKKVSKKYAVRCAHIRAEVLRKAAKEHVFLGPFVVVGHELRELADKVEKGEF